MNDNEFKPGEPGSDDQPRQHSGGTPKKEERHLTGPQAALTGNIGKTPNERNNNRNTPQVQATYPYPIRWLVARRGVSAPIAAIIAAELGWGGL